MKNTLLVAFLAFVQFQTFAQDYVWGKTTGSTGAEYARSVFVDGAGSVYTVGTFEGTVDFDPGSGTSNLTSAGLSDIYIQKLSSTGTFVFARRVGGVDSDIAYSMTINSSNEIFITGSFMGTVDFDPGAGVASLTSAGGTDIFILKLTAAGNWAYHQRMGSTLDDAGLTITCNSGSVAIGGVFNGTVDFDPGAGTFNLTSAGTAGFITRYTSSMSYTYAAMLGSVVNAATMDASGNVYSTGYFSGVVDFDPSAASNSLTSAGNSDIFLSKLSATGAYVMAKSFGGAAGDGGYAVTLDASGNIYTSGYFGGTADLDPGATTYNLVSGGSNDIYVQKLTAAGDFVWAGSFSGTGDDRGVSMTVDASGNVYTAGYFRNTIDMDPGAGVQNVTSGGISEGFVSKLDVNGNYVWGQKIGSTGNDAVFGITRTAANELFLAGYFAATVDMNPTATVTNFTASGTSDFMVLKWVACAVPVAPTNTTPAGNLIVCGSGTAALSASGTGTLGWYDQASGGNYLGGGASYTTGSIAASTNYYVQDSSCVAGPRKLISVTVISSITDQTLAATTATVCAGQTSTASLNNSEMDVVYYLRNDSDNSIVTGPVNGTGSTLNLSTGPISTNTTYNILAQKTYPGYALNLDGTNDYVNLGANNRGLGATMTVSARVKAVATGVNQFIAYKYDGTLYGFLLFIDAAGKAKFDGRDGSGGYKTSGASSTVVTDGQWHEITGVVRSTGWEIYVDGVLENSTAVALGSGGLGSTANFYVGSNGGTFYSSLDINNLTLWNTALSAAAISSNITACLSGSETNLTALFKFNDGTGTTAVDMSPSALNGTLLNFTAPACWISAPDNCLTGCQQEMSSLYAVTVNSVPAQPAISASGSTTICSVGSVTLTSSAGTSYLWSTGATTASIVVSTAGTYTVQVTNAAGCQSVASAGTTVTVGTPPAQPTISAGGATTFCQGGSVTLTSSAGTSYLWSTGATTASISPTTAGTYTVQVSDAAGCLSSSSAGTTVTVNSLPSTPTISAGGATTFCAGGSVTLTASAGTSYLWSTGATSASISPTTSGTYTVQVTNAAGCQSSASAGTTVTVNSLPATPTITAGGATTFCAGGSVTLTASAGTSYLWSTGATTASITPTTAGTYTVQVTNAAGCQSVASAATTVTVGTPPAQPTISAGGATTFCPGGSVTLTSSAGTSYLWSTGATTASITPTTAGTYTVQVTNAAGCQSVASAGTTVTVNALPTQPTISAGGSTTFCQGGSVTLTSSAGTSYLWSTGATTASITPTTAGTYTVQVTNAAGCQSSASAGTTVTVNALPSQPTISAGGPTTFCQGGSVTLTSSAGTSYLWSTGATTASITPTTAGTYTVQVTNAAGCQSSASAGTAVTVNALPTQPTISAGGSTTFCQGGSVTLTSSAGTSYLWSTGATTASINVSTAGTYTVQITNAAGCQSVASAGTTVTVNALPTQPTISAGGSTTFCEGGSVTLTSSGGTSYLWSTGATTASITPTTAGTYTVQVTNAAGCQSSASAGTAVTVNALPTQPTISSGGPTTFCQGGSVTLTSSAGISYLWSTGETTAAITPSTAGSYTVQVTNAAGCQSIASAGTTVTVNSLPSTPTITAGGATTFCDGGSVTLTASTGTTYLWSNGATTASITPTTAGTYTVQVTNAAGCQSVASAGTLVTVNALPSQPTITAGGPTTFCTGGSVTLTASAGSSYLWSDGSMSASINPSSSGTYTVQVTNAAGCQSIASAATTVNVNSLPAQPTISAGGATTFCAGGSVTMTASAGTSYLWSTGATTASISTTTSGSFTVQVTNAAGCQSTSSTATTVTVNTIPSITTGTVTNPTSCTIGNGAIEVVGSGTGTISWSGTASGTMTGTTLPANVSNLINGSYQITFTDANGCTSNTLSNTLSAPSAPAAPTITAGGASTFCEGGSVTLTASTGTTYQWSTGATTASIVATTAGNYTVSITDAAGCSSAASTAYTVTVNPLPVISIGTVTNPTTCTSTDGAIEVVGSGSGDLIWSGTASGSATAVAMPYTITALENGTYSILFTDGNGCVSQSLTGNVTSPSAPSAPIITSVGSTTLCEGDVVTLMSSNGDTYLWSTGETTQSIDVTAAGTYTVSITDLSGCTSPSSSGTTVVVNPIPVATTSLSGITITATTVGASYQWIDCANNNQPIAGETSQDFTATANGSYAVIVTENGCSDTSACVAVTSVGVEELTTLIDMRLQPNPTMSDVTIVANVVLEKVEIYTMAGELVQEETNTTFSVRDLSKGIYLVKVLSAKGITTLRLIKE